MSRGDCIGQRKPVQTHSFNLTNQGACFGRKEEGVLPGSDINFGLKFPKLSSIVSSAKLSNQLDPKILRTPAPPTVGHSPHFNYGVVAMPCRIRHPDRKGKVEAGIGHTQRTPLKGLRFESLEEAQTYLDRWEVRWADKRIHGTTKRKVAAMFAEEKPALLPPPLEPFRFYQYG